MKQDTFSKEQDSTSSSHSQDSAFFHANSKIAGTLHDETKPRPSPNSVMIVTLEAILAFGFLAFGAGAARAGIAGLIGLVAAEIIILFAEICRITAVG